MLSISTALDRRTRHDDTRLRGDSLSRADGRTVQSAKYNPTIGCILAIDLVTL